MTAFGGFVESGWEAVETAFRGNFERGEETGASVAVYHRGRPVAHLWGGSFDGGDQAYDDSTLQLVFSTTKGITAIAVAICAGRGLIDYDAPVSQYWPEFAAKGKGDATVAQLLSHQCGLFSVQGELSLAEALDWATITARLADTEPEWPIGSTHGYHALTYGWLAGELVRRVDPEHRSIGRFVAEEIVAPTGTELYIGLPESCEPRVAPILGSPLASGDSELDPAVKAMIEQFMGPNTRGGRALSLNGAFSVDGAFNRRDVHAAEIPAANGITNSISLAKIYASTFAEVDGVRLIDPTVLERARTTITPAEGFSTSERPPPLPTSKESDSRTSAQKLASEVVLTWADSKLRNCVLPPPPLPLLPLPLPLLPLPLPLPPLTASALVDTRVSLSPCRRPGR